MRYVHCAEGSGEERSKRKQMEIRANGSVTAIQLLEERQPVRLGDESGVKTLFVDGHERADAEFDKQLLNDLQGRVELDHKGCLVDVGREVERVARASEAEEALREGERRGVERGRRTSSESWLEVARRVGLILQVDYTEKRHELSVKCALSREIVEAAT